MKVKAPNKGKDNGQHIPDNLVNPDYSSLGNALHDGAKTFPVIAQYISPQEWSELANGINSSIRQHHWCNSPCAMIPFVATCGVCFCPLLYIGLQMQPTVNAEMSEMPIVNQLAGRGITMEWEANTKFTIGGLHLTFSSPPALPTSADQTLAPPGAAPPPPPPPPPPPQ